MKSMLLGVLLTGLALAPLSEAKRSSPPAKPVCAQGKFVATFDDDGVATRDYRYYRCLLKQEQDRYLIQDFYWPSGKKQMEPLTVTKAGLHEWNNSDARVNGLFVKWYENGRKAYESNYVDGEETGPLTIWYESGQKKIEGQNTAGKATGRWIYWHENGQKAVEGESADDEKTGLWLQWYENGQKASEGRYVDGRETGAWTVWYPNGKKAGEGQYANGNETGLWTFWYEDGRKTAEIQYKDGEKTILKAWDEDGKPVAVPSEFNLLGE